MKLTTYLHLVPMLGISGAIPPLPLCSCLACTKKTLCLCVCVCVCMYIYMCVCVCSKMDKWAKVKLVRSPRENGGG